MIALDWHLTPDRLFEEAIRTGESIFWLLSHGQIELGDWIHAMAREIGEVEGISVWTYSLARSPEEGAGFLVIPSGMTRVVLNYGQQSHREKSLPLWRELCPHLDVRVTRTHAKIARVWGNGKKYLVHGSGNASKTTQLVEQWQVLLAGTEEIYRILDDVEAALPPWGAHGRTAHAASGCGRTAIRRAVTKKFNLRPLRLDGNGK